MTRALVIYESMYGNNQQLAGAIAEGIRSAGHTVETLEVNDAPRAIPSDVSLVVVGGPNHATGMPRQSDRKSAAKQSPNPLVSTGITLREWFDQLEQPAHPLGAAAWDSRLAKPRFARWFDRASRGIEKRLKKRGFTLAAPAENFYVATGTGPLADGELDRARQWGERLAKLAATAAAAR